MKFALYIVMLHLNRLYVLRSTWSVTTRWVLPSSASTTIANIRPALLTILRFTFAGGTWETSAVCAASVDTSREMELSTSAICCGNIPKQCKTKKLVTRMISYTQITSVDHSRTTRILRAVRPTCMS